MSSEPTLTDAEIEAMLVAEMEANEHTPSESSEPLMMAQSPEHAGALARWMLVGLFLIVLVSGWIKAG